MGMPEDAIPRFTVLPHVVCGFSWPHMFSVCLACGPECASCVAGSRYRVVPYTHICLFYDGLGGQGRGGTHHAC